MAVISSSIPAISSLHAAMAWSQCFRSMGNWVVHLVSSNAASDSVALCKALLSASNRANSSSRPARFSAGNEAMDGMDGVDATDGSPAAVCADVMRPAALGAVPDDESPKGLLRPSPACRR